MSEGWTTIINIPESAWEHFWDEPPEGHREFWSFRFKPKCGPGDKLVFHYRGQPVARATVDEVERPGQFRSGWKVFWTPESFEIHPEFKKNWRDQFCFYAKEEK